MDSNEYPQHVIILFLSKTVENHPLVIIKYPLDLVPCTVIVLKHVTVKSSYTKNSVREVTNFANGGNPLQNLLLPLASLVRRENKSRVFFLF